MGVIHKAFYDQQDGIKPDQWSELFKENKKVKGMKTVKPEMAQFHKGPKPGDDNWNGQVNWAKMIVNAGIQSKEKPKPKSKSYRELKKDNPATTASHEYHRETTPVPPTESKSVDDSEDDSNAIDLFAKEK